MTRDDTGGDDTVTLICDLDAPPETVWRALTEPRLLSLWLMPNDIRPAVGARFSFLPGPGDPPGRVDCEVLAVEPGRHLSYRWRTEADGEAVDSVVRFELGVNAVGGTRLHLVHSGLPAALDAGLGRLGGAGRLLSMAAGHRSAMRRRRSVMRHTARRLPWAA